MFSTYIFLISSFCLGAFSPASCVNAPLQRTMFREDGCLMTGSDVLAVAVHKIQKYTSRLAKNRGHCFGFGKQCT